MPAIAKIKFTQGATIGVDGEALFGIAGSEVTVENAGDNPDIENYTFEMIDVPPGSANATGLVQDGAATQYKFTPTTGIPGCYLLRLTVRDTSGAIAVDERVFGIKEPDGNLMPSFKAKGTALNFAGQKRGWAKFIEEWLRSLVAEIAAWVRPNPAGAAALAETKELNYLKKVITLNATPVDVFTIAPPKVLGCKYILIAQAILADGTLGATFWKSEDIRRTTGNLARIGAAVANVDLGTVKDAGAPTADSWNAELVLSGATLIARVTGGAYAVHWVVRIQEVRNSNASVA